MLEAGRQLQPQVCVVTFTCVCRDDEYEQDHSESGHRHHCLPPVSPCRCRRQAVLDLLFDGVWQQLVGWMEELLQHQWECCTVGRLVEDFEQLGFRHGF